MSTDHPPQDDLPTMAGGRTRPTSAHKDDQRTLAGQDDQQTLAGHDDRPTMLGREERPTLVKPGDVPTLVRPEDVPTLAGGAAAGDTGAAGAAALRGRMIGRYRILRLIGEGGMGAVYEAEQDQPRRTVALKVIKAGLAGPELLRRFAQEAQALGRLQHPGIAQIYDAGTADAGYGPQPYFAMEFIRGAALREYADSHHLSARQRLELMVRVCEAVHHAHQRGLIHRDLKPGNILVDEAGQPKVLDFGVARATDSDAQATMQTDIGQLVGTLAYMSPEQVLADPLDLDTRSDVYALGVILYELLARRLPYDLSSRLPEALATIREQDPSRLSAIDRAFRGDIETIAAKALEKDKTRRYASAAELAADITRYLKDEPIVAQPPSTRYQLQKFARRHKALVAGVAAVFVVLVAGVVVSTWQAVRASRAEAAALRDRDLAAASERAATAARDQAVSAQRAAVTAEEQARLERDRAVSEKARADTESATAKAVSEFMQKNLFEQVTGGGTQGGAAVDLSVSGALDRAAARVDGQFARQPLVEAGVREAVARAFIGLSLFDKAAPQLERALVLRRRAQGTEDVDVLKAEHLLAIVYVSQRKLDQGFALLERVVRIHGQRFGADHVDTLRFGVDLTALYLTNNRAAEAEPHAVRVAEGRRRTLGPGHKDTITATILLAAAFEFQKKLPAALRAATTAHDAAVRALGDKDVLTLNALTVLQRIRLRTAPGTSPDRAARDEFLANAARTVENAKANSLPELIALAASRADIAIGQGRPQDAEAPLLEALEAARRTGQEEPNLNGLLAGVYAQQKKYAEAEATLARVVMGSAASKSLNPNILPFALRNLGGAYRNDGRFADAERHLRALVPLVLANPGESVAQTRIDMMLLADTYSSQQKWDDAERVFTQVAEIQRRLAPDILPTPMVVANIGWVRLRRGRFADAEATLREASSAMARIAPDSWERYNTESMLGAALAGQKRFEDAERLLLSGYGGMTTRKPSNNATVVSRFTPQQAGEAIVQLYAAWGRNAQRTQWAEKTKVAAKTP